MLRVPRQRDAPLQARAGDREVAKSRPDEPERLVAAELGDDRSRVGRVPLEQPVLEPRETEEVVLLLEVLDRSSCGSGTGRRGAARRRCSTPRRRRSTCPRTRRARCRRRRSRPAASCCDADAVARLGRADEVVVRDVERAATPTRNCGAITSANCLRREARCVGRLLDLEAVLVGTGEEVDVVAEQPVPAGERIADDRRVRVSEVGLGVHVVDGCGQVEAAHEGRGYVCHRSTVLLVCGWVRRDRRRVSVRADRPRMGAAHSAAHGQIGHDGDASATGHRSPRGLVSGQASIVTPCQIIRPSTCRDRSRAASSSSTSRRR